ncbi:ribonuclease 3-like protein 3 [Phtheirospermum japonicum]|uniref:Ribonuclease 3-like protein 3 n=1 Tax=Phtheirospermum japonicum TaxID=374723 RepID=A0A830DN73_9LAMI|nr:ribonuclease 3-like protein 3 [Phtheirospermum japonicum]
MELEVEETAEMFLPFQDLFLDEENKQEQEQDENSNRVKSILEITGYGFQDPILLQQAFTHHSYEEGCSSLDRLAYVGDSVLNFLIAKEHYLSYPDFDPGRLTRLRAVNVDTEKLARVALKHQLHKLLRHNIILLGVQVKEFTNAMVEYPLHSSGLIDAPKVLADVVESLIGAIFIDSKSSVDTTWKIVKNLLEPIISPAALPTHPVTQLRELCQRKGFTVKIRDNWIETGEIEVVVDEEFVGRAKYSAKRVVAKNRAALDAYNQIVEKLHLQN